MTIKEVSKQLYDLSVGGWFNGEKFTLEELENHIENAFKGTLKLGNKYVMEIALPDGRWLFTVDKYGKNEYDYFIPETREQEKKIIDKLTRV